MTTHLLNSAVMPQPGFYELRSIDANEFAELVQEAHLAGHLQHHISVTDRTTLAFVKRLTGIDLEKRHWQHSITYNFEIADGDTFLVISFKYRIIPHHRRSDGPRLSDFDFYKSSYAKDQAMSTDS